MRTLWDFEPQCSSILPEPDVWDVVDETFRFGDNPYLLVAYAQPLRNCWFMEWL